MQHEKIEAAYHTFFDLNGIDRITGMTSDETARFATFPFIGSRYGDGTHTRILFVGLDIGKDEKSEGIQSFQERQKRIEMKNPADHNPHIAGTFMTALYFLRQQSPEYADFWQKAKNDKSSITSLKREDLPSDNPLSYVALTNFHKFVTVGRAKRAGDQDRRQIMETEPDLFISEFEALKPEIVIFQGSKFRGSKFTTIIELLRKESEVFIGYHPSARGEIRNPMNFMNGLEHR